MSTAVKNRVIAIDGSVGEGGGQMLRSSLSLSLLTGKPFRIENIRAARKTPGLLRQHLTAVQACAAIGSGSVEGASLGSTQLTFAPGAVRGGEYSFNLGGAGSTMLVLQTVLIPLLLADGATTLALEGGTHNPAAPPFEFLEKAFLPIVQQMGGRISLELERPGFYPGGGGRVVAKIEPSRSLQPITLHERGRVLRRCVRAVVANLPWDIARREAEAVASELELDAGEQQAHTLTGSAGPGNAVSVFVESENVTEVFTAFGQRGVRAEHVANDVAKQAKRYLNSGAAVGEHLADQLLLPMAVAGGGTFTSTPLSLHATTNIDVIRKFIDVQITAEPLSRGVVRVAVSSSL